MPLVQSIISTVSDSVATHEDIYGKGGYVIIDTGETGKTNINDWITPQRRKEGMVVYDINTTVHYRCLGTTEGTNPDDNWELTDFGGADSLGQLTDVTITNLESGQYLKYNGSKWINVDLLSDIDYTVVTAGTGIAVDFTTGTNEYSVTLDANITDLNDIIFTGSISDGKAYYLKGDNTTNPTAVWDISLLNLENINNVNIPTTPVNGYVLTWNGSQNQWEAADIPIISADSTDSVLAPATAPYLLWSTNSNLENSLVLLGESGVLFVETGDTDGNATISIVDGGVTNAKLANSTISGVSLGNNLNALNFGNNITVSTTNTYYDGSEVVTIDVSLFLNDLNDVSISTATEGDILVYEGTTGWSNSNVIYGGSSTSF